ncbi:hypothetical protein B0J17DRAFT_627041 [Rhizoctonia solani]|nr:hypothetical protein B0J17DRAFT_627041 [Rhizoctonia solani]
MDSNSDSFGEQSFLRDPPSGGTDTVDPTTFSLWMDEAWSESELADTALQGPSGMHVPLSAQNSLQNFSNDALLHVPEPTYSTFDEVPASTTWYSAQQAYYDTNHTSCYDSFDDTDDTAKPTAPAPLQMADSFPWPLPSPNGLFTEPNPSDFQHLSNEFGGSYLSQTSGYSIPHEYLQLFAMRVPYWDDVPIRFSENTGLSIGPHQMHLANPMPPSEVEEELGRVSLLRPQLRPLFYDGRTAFSTSSSYSRLTSEYETPNSIVLEAAASQKEEDNSIIEWARKYRKVLKNKRIICLCSQDPELRSMGVKCRGLERGYKSEHEWKRAHKIERDISCESCGKTFKRKDSKDNHRDKHCHPET